MAGDVRKEVFGLLEMGSNSLKLYLVPRSTDGGSSIETVKHPWRVAHDLYSQGAIGEETSTAVVDAVREACATAGERNVVGLLAIATGVFRELPDMETLAARIQGETGVRPRVIGGDDEASLMARGFRELAIPAPALMCDLGGASLEWAFLPREGAGRSGSVALGAIRHAYRFAHLPAASDEYLAESTAACDAALAAWPAVAGARVIATGGTAEALAALTGSERVSARTLGEVLASVRRDGPPDALKPTRRAVFLPGLVILSRVVHRCAADGLTYGTSAVRLGMVRRLVQLLERFPPDALHATQLLRKTRVER